MLPILCAAVLWCRVVAAAEESQALGLRQKGNDAFKAGQLQQALDFYWQAVSHNPQDYALFNNISLVALKKGDVKQVGVSNHSNPAPRACLPALVRPGVQPPALTIQLVYCLTCHGFLLQQACADMRL